MSFSCGYPKHAATEPPRQLSPSVLESSLEDSDLPPPYNPGQQRLNSTTSPPQRDNATTLAIFALQKALLQGHHTDRPSMVYVSFSTSDLYKWKAQNPPFSEKPQALMRLLESVFQTHHPTWDNCQQLLFTLFTTEECGYIQVEAQKIVAGERKLEKAGKILRRNFPSPTLDR